MAKALVTFAVGPHKEILKRTRPLFAEYAHLHNYEYLEPRIQDPPLRPASWMKIPSLLEALSHFDDVLWLDCDVVILDNYRDILNDIPKDRTIWQSMVRHTYHAGVDMGEVPSCGVWHVRPPMVPVLEEVWNMGKRSVNQPWWEQASLHQLMGYEQQGGELVFPVVHIKDTELYNHTKFLPLTWNCTDYHNLEAAPNFMHLAGEPSWTRRIEDLEFWLTKCKGKIL